MYITFLESHMATFMKSLFMFYNLKILLPEVYSRKIMRYNQICSKMFTEALGITMKTRKQYNVQQQSNV